VPATLSLLSAALGAGVGALALRASRSRGWGEVRWFAVIAFTAAAYGLANLGATLGMPERFILVACRAQVAAMLLHYLGWMRYAEACGGVAGAPPARWLERLVGVVALLALVPGLVDGGRVMHHAFTPWHIVYSDPGFSPLGYALLLACTPAPAVVVARFVAAARGNVRFTGLRLAAFACVLLLTVNDALAATGWLNMPYLLDGGFIAPVALVGWATALWVGEAARDLDELKGRLEALVGWRSQALTLARERLVHAERLAALGQLANGVAHQVSNPAAVVTANLRYLAGGLPRSSEAGEVVADALSAMQDINELVRRLADAGRIATARPADGASLDELLERVVGPPLEGAQVPERTQDALPGTGHPVG
jgi:hypothetical protein